MAKFFSTTVHHCPERSKGNCRKGTNPTRCSAHQTFCSDHHEVFLREEGCRLCRLEAESEARAKEAMERETCKYHNDITHSKASTCPKCDEEKKACPQHSDRCQPKFGIGRWFCSRHQAQCKEHPTEPYEMNRRRVPCHACRSEKTIQARARGNRTISIPIPAKRAPRMPTSGDECGIGHDGEGDDSVDGVSQSEAAEMGKP